MAQTQSIALVSLEQYINICIFIRPPGDFVAYLLKKISWINTQSKTEVL